MQPIIDLDLDPTRKYFPIKFCYARVNIIQVIVLTKVWRTDWLTDRRSVIQVLPFSRKSWIGSKKLWAPVVALLCEEIIDFFKWYIDKP